MKVQNEHSTLGCDEHFDDKSNILERYYNCDAPIYSGADRDVQLKAGVRNIVKNYKNSNSIFVQAKFIKIINRENSRSFSLNPGCWKIHS